MKTRGISIKTADLLRSRRLSSERGMTLVEVMVATGLFGVLSLIVATLFVQNSQNVTKTTNEAELSERMSELSLALENYIGNTTRLLDSNCNTLAHRVYDDTVKITTDTSKLFLVESEDANFPGEMPAAAQCDKNGAASVGTMVGGANLPPRGCKRTFSINFVAPTSGSSIPGYLEIKDESAGRVVNTIPGVYEIRCGVIPSTTGTGLPSFEGVRFKILMKARMSNSATNFEGWAPGDPGFNNGTHRSFESDISFRNLTTPGVHFGKANSSLNCLRNGQSSANGDCCSGYTDASDLCAAGCTTAGGTPSGTNKVLNCCSHAIDPVGGTCL